MPLLTEEHSINHIIEFQMLGILSVILRYKQDFRGIGIVPRTQNVTKYATAIASVYITNVREEVVSTKKQLGRVFQKLLLLADRG